MIMEIFTVDEFQEKWDELIKRVEKGEHIGIVNENGKCTVMIPSDDELLKIYVENNNEAP